MKTCDEYEKLTEEQALKKLNYQESLTIKEANDILYSLCDAVNDRVAKLPEKIIGTYSYYEGEFNGMDIAIRLLSKLEHTNQEAEWVYDHWCEFKCSNCGNWSNSKPYKGKEKYCPECGYKMRNT